MEDIARMADECMRDLDEDEDDSNLEDDEDLLVGVNYFISVLMAGFLSVQITRLWATWLFKRQ